MSTNEIEERLIQAALTHHRTMERMTVERRAGDVSTPPSPELLARMHEVGAELLASTRELIAHRTGAMVVEAIGDEDTGELLGLYVLGTGHDPHLVLECMRQWFERSEEPPEVVGRWLANLVIGEGLQHAELSRTYGLPVTVWQVPGTDAG